MSSIAKARAALTGVPESEHVTRLVHQHGRQAQA